MALCDFHWFSHTLQKQVATTVLLPDVGEPPFATFYLLHGLSDDHTIWARRTRIEHYVRDLPLIVVMPDGFRGFYTNNERGPAYANYIGEELVSTIERCFPAKASSDARCIGGLSMGGYGALRIALGYPGKFASANSHSGALMIGSRAASAGDVTWRAEIYGDDPRGSSHDLLHLAAAAKRARRLPKLLLDCGHDDFLIEDNRQFHERLDAGDISHVYREFAGVHDWDYWDEHVREAIEFHVGAMKLDVKRTRNSGPRKKRRK